MALQPERKGNTMALSLEDNSTHFNCAGCSRIKPVKKGKVTRVAYSIFDNETMKKFGYHSYYVMLCDECRGVKDKTKDRTRREAKK